MEDLNEIGAVWRGELTRALKSGRIVALLVLYLVFTLLALGVLGAINVRINDTVSPDKLAAAGVSADDAQAQMLAQKKQLLSAVFDEPVLSALLPLPVVLLFVFKLSLFFVPLFVALMGFDQVSGDVGPRSIRYYVVRVRRSSLVVGKFLTQLTLYAGLAAVSVLTMTVVARVLNSDFGTGDAALWFLKLILASTAFGLAYVGLTALCSSLVRTSAISLILNVIALFVLWVTSFVGGSFFLLPDEKAAAGTLSSMLKSESAWGYLRYASIWHFEPNLLHPAWATSVPALAVHVGFALVCLGTATVVLRTRDV